MRAALVAPLLLAAAAPDPRTDGCPGTYAFFATDSAQLDSTAANALRLNWRWMRPLVEGGAWLNLEGRTDDVGPEAYNLELSRRRAEAVRDYMISLGARPEQLRVRAYGETSFQTASGAAPATESERAQNRSVYVGPEMTLDVFHRFFPPGVAIC